MSIDFRKGILVVGQFGIVGLAACSLLAQDTRKVSEPSFPNSCVTIHATLQTNTDGTLARAFDSDTVSATQTSALETALRQCAVGQAVELALGANSKNNAFLINPLKVPAGVSLVVDGGVTVFGSRNPANYQVEGAHAECGVPNRFGDGCKSLLSFGGNSGIYGYGVIDGRGYAPMSTGLNSGKPWWDLTTEVRNGQNQNLPKLIIANGDNFTVYKITLRHAPFYHLQWTGDGLTVWGMKLQGV